MLDLAGSLQPSAFMQSKLNSSSKKKTVEDPFQAAKRENQNLLVPEQKREGQSVPYRGSRQWMHESGLFRSLLLELYSTLASWLKIAP